MLERTFEAKLLKRLHSHPALGSCVIWKISDGFTRGLPDFAVINGKHSEYFEVKIAPHKPEKIQRFWLNKIREGASWIQASTDGKKATMFYHDGAFNFYTFDELVEAIVRRCVN